MPRVLTRQDQNPDAYRDSEDGMEAVPIHGRDAGAERRALMRANTARMQRQDEEARLGHAGKTAAGQLMNSQVAAAARERARHDTDTPSSARRREHDPTTD